MGNDDMGKALADLLEAIGMEPKARDAVTAYAMRHAVSLGRTADEAYAGELPDFPICRHRPFQRLAALCYGLQGLKDAWRQDGLPQDVFAATCADIALRQRLYREKTGRIGLSKEDAIWLRHLFGRRIFKLGSLQFQPFEMIYLDEETIGEPYMSFAPGQKKRLPPGAPVLNVHIQQGANLSPEAVDRSFERAEAFFRACFPHDRYEAFICYSWLLYPGIAGLLAPGSNILAFASRFTIVGEVRDDAQAVERIFGGRRRARKDYPQRTSLQRAALLHWMNLGYACGVIPRPSRT